MMTGKAPRIVFQPATYRGFQRGTDCMVNAVRPTLGPLPRVVANQLVMKSTLPELLDNGGIIARRMLGLPDRTADMGAMLVRHMMWSVYQDVGDGTVTAAVLFQAIYNEGVRYVVAGGNAMRLRHHLESGMALILDELDGMTRPLQGKQALAQAAESICHDPPLAALLGEIFDIIGEYGQLELRDGHGRELVREYVEGMYWDGGILARQMLDPVRLRVDLENVSILVSDLALEDPRALMPVLETVIKADNRALLVLATKVAPEVTALLLAASKEPERFRVIAAKLPGTVKPDQMTAMEDLAYLVGGRALVAAAGDTLGGFKLESLGRARRVWADKDYLGIIGGKGSPRALREHVIYLRTAYQRATDREARAALRKRIGKLLGGSATLWVGAITEAELKRRREVAERTADAIRGVVQEGVVPGGGVALLGCQSALRERLSQCKDADERAAYRILVKAMETPLRALVGNAGRDAAAVLGEIAHAPPGYGIDLRSDDIVDIAQAGIWDATSVQKRALRSAISTAALALTTDVLIQHAKPEQALEP